MKLSSAVKTALALVLSATIALGLIAGISPVKAWAVNVTVVAGSSSTATIPGVDIAGSNIYIPAAGNPTWATMTLILDNGDNTGNFRLTANPGSNVAPGIYNIVFNMDTNPAKTVTVTIIVTAPGENPKSPDNGNGEDPILSTLPPVGPDGHQHSWSLAYGSTYKCDICNTLYTAYPAHEHQYEWYVTKPATETDDGEAHHMCKICGAVDMKEPVGAYYLFSQNTENKINKAPVGGTVNVETYRWLSFQGYVLDALAKRPDVTLNVTFRENGYKGGEVKTVTIPAGYDAASLKDANGYCGFKYLVGVFGAN